MKEKKRAQGIGHRAQSIEQRAKGKGQKAQGKEHKAKSILWSRLIDFGGKFALL